MTKHSKKQVYIWGEDPSQRPSPKRVTRTRNIRIDSIFLRDERRPINKRRLRSLQKSIKREGLMHPIQVYRLDGIHKGRFGLCAGLHRLRAMENLGSEMIMVSVLTRAEAKMWVDSENLHRSELRVLDRSEAIARHGACVTEEALAEKTVRGGRQPSDRGISRVAKDLALDRTRVSDAIRHNSLPSKIKARLRRCNLDNSRKFLNDLAKMKDDKEQLAYIKLQSQPNTQRASIRKKVPADVSLKELDNRWRRSSFRPIFESQSEIKQKMFIEKCLGLYL